MAEELVKSGRGKIVFDITGVTYINSAGIGMLAMTAGKLKERGGKLVLISSAGRAHDAIAAADPDPPDHADVRVDERRDRGVQLA